MSLGTHESEGGMAAIERVGVGVELDGMLVVRAGLRRGQLALPPNATVGDAAEALAEEHGQQVYRALMHGDRLRHSVSATVRSTGSIERATAETPLTHGDRVRFEVTE